MCLVFFFQRICVGIRSVCVSHFTCGSSRAGLGKTSSLRDVDWKYAPAPERQSLCSTIQSWWGWHTWGGWVSCIIPDIGTKMPKEWVISWIYINW